MITWQPIELAPKDGTQVLLAFVDSHNPRCVSFAIGHWLTVGYPSWAPVAGWYGDEHPFEECTAMTGATHFSLLNPPTESKA